MIKIFCDECGKEITKSDYVEKSIMVNYNFEESAEAIICKKCWNFGV